MIKINQINLKNIKGFIQGNYRNALKRFGQLPSYIEEQSRWRLHQVELKSPECFSKDECIHCGCKVSLKVFEERACSNTPACYPVMMNESEWETFKTNVYDNF